jgi:hypothetical protein
METLETDDLVKDDAPVLVVGGCGYIRIPSKCGADAKADPSAR